LLRHKDSTVPFQRRTVNIVLAIMSDGCRKHMRKRLDSYLSLVLTSFRDPVSTVQESACIAMSQFAEYLVPEIVALHSTILPTLFQALHSPIPAIQEKSCFALESFCEHLDEHVIPFVPQLTHTLLQMLHNPQTIINIKEMSISALASAITAAKEHFKPYLADTMAVMISCMGLVDDECLVLRTRATHCVAITGNAVGLESFEPYIQQVQCTLSVPFKVALSLKLLNVFS
jgi:hypothetical protein